MYTIAVRESDLRTKSGCGLFLLLVFQKECFNMNSQSFFFVVIQTVMRPSS